MGDEWSKMWNIIKVGENISKVMDALIRRVEEIVNSINEVKRILEGRLPAKPLVMPSKNGASYVQRGAPIYQIAASKVGNLRQNAYELHVRIVSLQNTLHLLIRTVYEMQ